MVHSHRQRCKLEEDLLLAKFGEHYVDYCNRTKTFIPYLA